MDKVKVKEVSKEDLKRQAHEKNKLMEDDVPQGGKKLYDGSDFTSTNENLNDEMAEVANSEVSRAIRRRRRSTQ